jgi:hypothetical protein
MRDKCAVLHWATEMKFILLTIHKHTQLSHNSCHSYHRKPWLWKLLYFNSNWRYILLEQDWIQRKTKGKYKENFAHLWGQCCLARTSCVAVCVPSQCLSTCPMGMDHHQAPLSTCQTWPVQPQRLQSTYTPSLSHKERIKFIYIRLEVFTVVTMKNAIFRDVMPCGSCKNWHFGGTYCLHHQSDKNF